VNILLNLQFDQGEPESTIPELLVSLAYQVSHVKHMKRMSYRGTDSQTPDDKL